MKTHRRIAMASGRATRRGDSRRWVCGILLGWCLLDAAVAERVIRRGDVVFMYDDPAMVEPYGCTVLGWAGRADSDRIAQAREQGIRHFSTSIGFLTEFQRVIDFGEGFLDGACRNLAGEPFIVPWLWDHRHDPSGHGAYWWCTNSPWYRDYLFDRLQTIMRTNPDGLHIDDYRGTSGAVTWLSACFCAHCMEGFRGYLRETLSESKQRELGIADLDAFDYRRFLLDLGVTPEDYPRRRGSLPLAGAFHDYQVKANTEFVRAYHQEASRLRGAPVSLSVNSGLNDPQALAIGPHLGYFCCEIPHGAERKQPSDHPIAIYKLGDALDRPIASTASGQDWAYTAEHRLPALIRGWIALSYAFGHNFMAPHRQWCYTEEKGTHWQSWPPEEFAWIYRFVRENADLFDGYRAAAPVAVVYDNAARRAGQGDVEPIALDLARRNIPFAVVAAGDDWLDARLTAEQLRPFRAVIVHSERRMDDTQAAVIDQVRAEGRLVVWPDEEALAARVPPPLGIEGSSDLMAVPRLRPGDPSAPAVIHLLSRAYNPDEDAWIPQRDIRLTIRAELFDTRHFTRAVWHQPGQDPVALDLDTNEQGMEIRIPECGFWGLAVLQ